MDYVTRILSLPRDLPALKSSAWLHRCAYNHTCNFARSLARRQRCERGISERSLQMRATPGPGPRTLLLRKELWDQVVKALQKLTPEQRELFVRHHLRDESVRDLARQTGRTTHAIEESLSNIRRRIPALLKLQGWSDEETRNLFRSTPVRPHTSRPK